MRLRSVPYKWLVAVAFVSGLFMDIMDSTIVNVALPTLGKEFNAGTTTLEWVVTGYLLSLAVWIPASGWVGDRFGTKKVFLFAMAMFSVGSALCGRAWSIDSLIVFRLLQGIGGGMMTPVGTAMLYRAFPADERATASAVLTVPTAIAPTIGPILGGWLVDHASWRWIFYINPPVGIAGFIFALLVLQEHKEENVGRFDWLGFVLGGAGLPLVLYALAQGPEVGWTAGRVLVSGFGGIALFAALIYVETHVPEPMLALRLFKDRMFRNGNLVVFVVFGAMLGILFLLPLFLQELLGLSAFQSGLTTFPQALGMAAVAQFSSRAYSRVGPRKMIITGLIGITVVSSLFLLVGLHTSQWWIRGLMMLRGAAMGMTMVPMQAATYATISREDTGRASALFSTNRQVAGSVGVAVMATVLVDRTKAHMAAALHGVTGGSAAIQAAMAQAGLQGYHDAFFATALFAFLGIGVALLIRDSDAAASMRRAPARAVPAGSAASARRASPLPPARRPGAPVPLDDAAPEVGMED
ncbi:MAG TPA: MDR family MFS transporter [Thermomicrobiaceae bacterium]|nr:MDR family MFS transporter [Thermomicrobiaceae bacterium]